MRSGLAGFEVSEFDEIDDESDEAILQKLGVVFYSMALDPEDLRLFLDKFDRDVVVFAYVSGVLNNPPPGRWTSQTRRFSFLPGSLDEYQMKNPQKLCRRRSVSAAQFVT